MAPNSVVAEELHRLARSRGGALVPETVLDAASDPGSPLHAAFDWDDAAGPWRLHQARVLIRLPLRQASVP